MLDRCDPGTSKVVCKTDEEVQDYLNKNDLMIASTISTNSIDFENFETPRQTLPDVGHLKNVLLTNETNDLNYVQL